MMHNPGFTTGSADTATGALSVNGPQPVWMTLNEARSRSFTGEVIFEDDPEVRAYLDAGIVYFAERVSDAPLGRRLVEAGVLDTEQLERGTVRVGDVEHLGRLFDREPTIDRDAVLVVTETSTEVLITDLANRAVTTVRATAYRHHPSGVHRWFVAQLGADAAARSARPLEANLIDDLPGFNLLVDDELLIEWDDFDELAASTAPADTDMFVFDSSTVTPQVPVDEPTPEPAAVETASIESDLDVVEFDYDDPDDLADAADAEVEVASAEGADVEVEVAEVAEGADVEVADADEGVSWGTDEFMPVVDRAGPVVDEHADTQEADEEFEFQVTWPDGTEDVVEASVTTEIPVTPETEVFTETDDGAMHFQMPELELAGEDGSDAEVPDDVADAVRRAIAAIESVTVEPEGQPGGTLSAQPVGAETALPMPQRFAPPTPDMRAEVIYGTEAAAQSEQTDVADNGAGGDERSSALRRLIGNLRRKDH